MAAVRRNALSLEHLLRVIEGMDLCLAPVLLDVRGSSATFNLEALDILRRRLRPGISCAPALLAAGALRGMLVPSKLHANALVLLGLPSVAGRGAEGLSAAGDILQICLNRRRLLLNGSPGVLHRRCG